MRFSLTVARGISLAKRSDKLTKTGEDICEAAMFMPPPHTDAERTERRRDNSETDNYISVWKENLFLNAIELHLLRFRRDRLKRNEFPNAEFILLIQSLATFRY